MAAPGARAARWILSLTIALAPPLAAAAAGGGGGGGGGAAPAPEARGGDSPEQVARKHYERGLRHRERALGYERKAEEKDKGFLFFAPPSEKAERQWQEAVEDFRKATRKRDFAEAFNELGYAYRKLGRYEESLEAYDQALAIEPDYAQALEYRGEASLSLGRLSDARAAYLHLFAVDRELAAQLMGAMQDWLAEADEEPLEGVSPDEVEAFRAWVAERAQLARQAGGDFSDARSW